VSARWLDLVDPTHTEVDAVLPAGADPDVLEKSGALFTTPALAREYGFHTLDATRDVDDIADGIVTAVGHPAAENEDFNISASDERTIADIARVVWEACGRDPAEFELRHLPTFEVDVQRRWPSVEKAERLLGWTPTRTWRDYLDEQGRSIIVLHYFLGLPLSEVATCLGIPVGTAKSRLHRSLAVMRLTFDAEATPEMGELSRGQLA